MIRDVEPVALVQTIPVKRHRDVVKRVRHEQRNHFFRKLIRVRSCSTRA